MVKGKRADLTIIMLAAIIVIIIIVMVINYFSKGCRSNFECGENSYCGSDYECHGYPSEEELAPKQAYNFLPASIVIGMAIIVAALILRKRKSAE